MTFQRVVVAVSVALALFVLGFLVRQTLQSAGDVEQFNLVQRRLAQIESWHSDLRRSVLEARIRLDGDTVRVSRLAQDIDEAVGNLGALGSIDGNVESQSLVVGSMTQTYVTAARAQVAQVQRFSSTAARLTASFEDLRNAAADGWSGSAALDAAQQTAVDALLDDVVVSVIRGRSADLAQARSRIEIVEAAAATAGAAGPALKLIAEKASETLDARQSLQVPLDAMAGAEPESSLTRLREAIADDYKARLESGRRYRLFLAIYTIGLFFALGFLGLRLRSSFRQLDAVNSELASANERLEIQVQERTADLSKALADVRAQQAQLIQSEKMASLGQMVAGVAHEINTPLGYARGNVETLQELVAPLRELAPGQESTELLEDFDALLGDARHGLDQIGELVMSLKDFSRVDRSKNELMDINDGIETALKICHNQLKGRIEIVREFEANLPRVPCAPSQINQVLLNLLNNAGQAIDGAGTIRIRTRRSGSNVEIAIKDSGCGMSEDVRAHIFEPFFTTKPVGSGTGLGLSIVFRIIEDHHGSIDVRSAPGDGAEFVILLPQRREAPAPAAAPQPTENLA